MGLIKAAFGAAGGVLADQWKDYFYCDSMAADVLMTKGHKRNSGRSSKFDLLVNSLFHWVDPEKGVKSRSICGVFQNPLKPVLPILGTIRVGTE